ncbi:sigma-70 family RNA polymerase sigma factor [Levilactobacillus zymae]|uniref:RNA polymerase sigma factor n=1 Tax=Levilactobacillus zymae TaxID=267363 RepID=UPI0028B68F3A|nr:sigma-70 family RNA polymerase sigma factor [Levilactobacillus zymae]MDT6979947.1 sigma-70 family RNA polymerase sigma factor [Levilactobacillus zymae]
MDLRQYEQLLDRLAVDLRQYLRQRGADPEIAADVVQDVFVKVLEADLFLPGDQLRPYLYRMAWTTYLDGYRRRRRYQELVSQFLGPAMPTSTVIEAPVADRSALVTALHRLKPRDRDLLVDRYLAQHSIKQLADLNQTTVAAIKMRLHRLHRKLEKMMRSQQNET